MIIYCLQQIAVKQRKFKKSLRRHPSTKMSTTKGLHNVEQLPCQGCDIVNDRSRCWKAASILRAKKTADTKDITPGTTAPSIATNVSYATSTTNAADPTSGIGATSAARAGSAASRTARTVGTTATIAHDVLAIAVAITATNATSTTNAGAKITATVTNDGISATNSVAAAASTNTTLFSAIKVTIKRQGPAQIALTVRKLFNGLFSLRLCTLLFYFSSDPSCAYQPLLCCFGSLVSASYASFDPQYSCSRQRRVKKLPCSSRAKLEGFSAWAAHYNATRLQPLRPVLCSAVILSYTSWCSKTILNALSSQKTCCCTVSRPR